MPLEIRSLTAGEVRGAGLYDELMRTAKSHLKEEFEAGRIIGTDYSNVYLGSMQANLGAANQFLLQYELTNKQLELIAEQINQAQKQNELLDLQKTQLEIANDTARYHLANTVVSQNAGQLAQNLLTATQKTQVDKQIEKGTAEIVQLTAQTALTGKQEDMVDTQIKTENANTSTPIAGLTKAQYDKTLAEQSILTQKLETERAQTEGTVDSTGTPSVGGLIGREMSLKFVQGESFIRDAEQKAAKFYADTLSIVYSADPTATDPDLWQLDPANSTQVLNKLMTGIGVTPV